MVVTPSPHTAGPFFSEISIGKRGDSLQDQEGSTLSSPTSSRFPPQRDTPILTQSQTLSDIQRVFNDAQKIAYVGLCYTIMYIYKTTRLKNQKRALQSFETWAVEFTEKMFVYLDVSKAGEFARRCISA